MRTKFILLILLLIAGLAGLILNRFLQINNHAEKNRNETARIIPVEAANIQIGSISLLRHFTGTLKARKEFLVSPKINGRIVHLAVDFGDSISRNQIVAKLDNEEQLQAVAQAEADLAVSKANYSEAQSLLKISQRELKRINKLSKKGFNSASSQDEARADQLVKQAKVKVSKAKLERAKAELEIANIQLGYTNVQASWQNGNESRIVAERLVNDGETVSANDPIFRIVEFDPITAEFFVTEKDYALLEPEQTVELAADAFSEQVFMGKISRISPVFREQSRQAKVEVSINNKDLRLKPGMYIRVKVIIKSRDEATIIPEQALTTRKEKKGVFVISPDNKSVTWHIVKTGIREQNLVEIIEPKLSGQVVTLGQQFLTDGSKISLGDSGSEK